MTKFELTEFLTWMTNHQPSSKQVLDEMYVYDVALVMQTVLAEIMQLRKERDELRQQVENIKNGFEGSCYACEPVGEMNKKLLKERDEARREASMRSRKNPERQREFALGRGWDCFKETP